MRAGGWGGRGGGWRAAVEAFAGNDGAGPIGSGGGDGQICGGAQIGGGGHTLFGGGGSVGGGSGSDGGSVGGGSGSGSGLGMLLGAAAAGAAAEPAPFKCDAASKSAAAAVPGVNLAARAPSTGARPANVDISAAITDTDAAGAGVAFSAAVYAAPAPAAAAAAAPRASVRDRRPKTPFEAGSGLGLDTTAGRVKRDNIAADAAAYKYKPCVACGVNDNDGFLCDGCYAVFHTCCVGLADVPEGDWFCQLCTNASVTMRGAGVAARAAERINARSAAAAAVQARAGPSAAAAAASCAAAIPARAASCAAAATTVAAATPFEPYAGDVYMQFNPRSGSDTHGRAVQVVPMKPMLKPSGIK